MAKKKQMSNLKQRLTTSAVAIPITLLLILLSEIPFLRALFVLGIAIVASFALVELYGLMEKKKAAPLTLLGVGTTICYLFATFTGSCLLPLVVLAASLLAAFCYFFNKGGAPLISLATTFFGLFYIAIPLSFLISTAYLFPYGSSDRGSWWLLYLIVVVKITDAAAYFAGKTLGRTKMAPAISPNKTWEGAAAGLAAAIIASLLFSFFTSHIAMTLPWFHALLLGALLSCLAQFGDLTESILKRDAGVKDSSDLPGLGGLLDLLDSLIFTAPALYIYLKIAGAPA